MKNKKTKVLAQMKSSHYYIFWGICTAAVVAGQLYVGSGYRIMAGSVLRLTMGMESVLSSPLR
tara:strand:+ start:380 stop:568 length:189 start_codon:yes stop_codon:yes gene_type:complete